MPPAAFIKRVTLIVGDVRRSIAFYRDVLGFAVVYDQVMRVGGKIIPAGLPGAHVHLAILEAGDPQVGKIGLLQWLDPPLAKPDDPYRERLALGDAVLALEARDAAAVAARVRGAQGVRLHHGLGESRDCLGVFDPDGFFVTLRQTETIPESPPVRLSHTTLLVRDIDHALAFYRGGIGFSVLEDRATTPEAECLPAGEPGAAARLLLLSGHDAPIGRLGLFQFTDPEIAGERPPRRHLGIGDVIFVAHSDDVRRHAEAIAAAGGLVHAAPDADRVLTATGAEKRLTTMSAFDPDGFFFELNTPG